MKINSSFFDFYDLPHSMDHDKEWDRITETTTIELNIAPLLVVGIYLGKTYTRVEGKWVQFELKRIESAILNSLPSKDEPIYLAYPVQKGLVKVISNPSFSEFRGLLSLDIDAYRVHQEIEAYLSCKGKLKHVGDN